MTSQSTATRLGPAGARAVVSSRTPQVTAWAGRSFGPWWNAESTSTDDQSLPHLSADVGPGRYEEIADAVHHGPTPPGETLYAKAPTHFTRHEDGTVHAVSPGEGIAYQANGDHVTIAGLSTQAVSPAACRIAREMVWGRLEGDGYTLLHTSAVTRNGRALPAFGAKGADKTPLRSQQGEVAVDWLGDASDSAMCAALITACGIEVDSADRLMLPAAESGACAYWRIESTDGQSFGVCLHRGVRDVGRAQAAMNVSERCRAHGLPAAVVADNHSFISDAVTGLTGFRAPTGYPVLELARLAFDPLTMAGREDWIDAALAVVDVYRALRPCLPTAEVQVCADIALLTLPAQTPWHPEGALEVWESGGEAVRRVAGRLEELRGALVQVASADGGSR